MVDFRYHLISLIAVILALAVGILAGSGFLGGPILEQLQRDVDQANETNDALQERLDVQDERLDLAESFARASEPFLVRGVLAGEDVVVFQFAGSAGQLIDGVKRQLVDAGARIASEITLTQKFALESAPSGDELALITGSLGADVDGLRREAATLLGERAAAAASADDDGPAPSGAQERFDAVASDLERAEFIAAEATEDGPLIPANSIFVVLGGSSDRAPFEATTFTPALSEGLAGRGAATAVVEGSDSVWGLVNAVRRDLEARSSAVTIDNGDSTIGRIAVVLALDRAEAGEVGHYGTRADDVIPPANASG